MKNCSKCNGRMASALHEDMLEGAEKRNHQRIPSYRCQSCGHVELSSGGVQLTEQGARRMLVEQPKTR